MSTLRAASMDKIVSLCKRRGFVYQASEIYGGIGNTYDYGPLGVELLRRVKDAWWDRMVRSRRDVVGLDSAIIQNPQTWITSGHVGGFSDPLIDNKTSKQRYRADHLVEGKIAKYEKKGRTEQASALQEKLNSAIGDNDALRELIMEAGIKCPVSGTDDWTEVRQFNLMFKTHIGAIQSDDNIAYLRPETAQGIFLNFKNVLESSRQKPPFGIAQIGKSFRNEITPGNFVFRTREFEQAEMEFFVPPAENDQWFEYWKSERHQWYVDMGIAPERLRMRDHEEDELAHYSTGCTDVEYEYPFGWGELEGIACRTDFDLKRHSEASGTDLVYFDPQSKEKYTPYVIEPAGGINRMALTFLIDAYDEEELEKDTRVVLRFHPKIAPITVAVFPLVKKDGMPEKATELEEGLRAAGFSTFYDEKGAIGRRYRRQDEVGTPYCVTVDGETLESGLVTIRERDSMEQTQVAMDEVAAHLRASMEAWQRPAT
ncbi:MAG: glycine--tRNA ligase [Planctomycetes bacterium]|nr:glycine--tRNA ligase [Planctomycetota bacterium]